MSKMIFAGFMDARRQDRERNEEMDFNLGRDEANREFQRETQSTAFANQQTLAGQQHKRSLGLAAMQHEQAIGLVSAEAVREARQFDSDVSSEVETVLSQTEFNTLPEEQQAEVRQVIEARVRGYKASGTSYLEYVNEEGGISFNILSSSSRTDPTAAPVAGQGGPTRAAAGQTPPATPSTDDLLSTVPGQAFEQRAEFTQSRVDSLQPMAGTQQTTQSRMQNMNFSVFEDREGLPRGYLQQLAMAESGGDPNARNPSGAAGLFGFMPATAREFGIDPFNVMQATDGAARYAARSAKVFRDNFGRDPSADELYLLHQQGIGGGPALLRNPNASAVDVLARANNGNVARARASILQNNGDLNMTAGQFSNHVMNHFNRQSGPAPDQNTAMAQSGGPTNSSLLASSGVTFVNEGQDRIDPVLAGVLSGAAQEFGGLTITSGFRDEAYNRSVGGARNSAHVQGTAADIDMSGMDETERSRLVESLLQRGAKGFITYTDSPNMLHVDMGLEGSRPNVHFMHDKSNRTIAQAPGWMRSLADRYQGTPGVDPQSMGQAASSMPRATPTPPSTGQTSRRGSGGFMTPGGVEIRVGQSRNPDVLPSDHWLWDDFGKLDDPSEVRRTRTLIQEELRAGTLTTSQAARATAMLNAEEEALQADKRAAEATTSSDYLDEISGMSAEELAASLAVVPMNNSLSEEEKTSRTTALNAALEARSAQERAMAINTNEPLSFFPIPEQGQGYAGVEEVPVIMSVDGTYVNERTGEPVDTSAGFVETQGMHADRQSMYNQFRSVSTDATEIVNNGANTVQSALQLRATVQDNPAALNRVVTTISGATGLLNQLNSAMSIGDGYNYEEIEGILGDFTDLADADVRIASEFLGTAYNLAAFRGSSGQALSDNELLKNLQALGEDTANPTKVLDVLNSSVAQVIDLTEQRRQSAIGNITLMGKHRQVFMATKNYAEPFNSYLPTILSGTSNPNGYDLNDQLAQALRGERDIPTQDLDPRNTRTTGDGQPILRGVQTTAQEVGDAFAAVTGVTQERNTLESAQPGPETPAQSQVGSAGGEGTRNIPEGVTVIEEREDTTVYSDGTYLLTELYLLNRGFDPEPYRPLIDRRVRLSAPDADGNRYLEAVE